MKKQLLLVLSVLIVGLTGCYEPGQSTRLTKSSNFNSSWSMKIIALPFTVQGNPEIQTDQTATNEIMSSLMSRGFTVVDPYFTSAQATSLGIDIHKEMSPSDINKLATALGAKAILLGTVSYDYQPEAQWTDPISITTDTNSHGRKIGTSVSGGGSHHVTGHYFPSSMVARLVSAQDCEVLVSATVNNDSRFSMAEEMAAAIKKRL